MLLFFLNSNKPVLSALFYLWIFLHSGNINESVKKFEITIIYSCNSMRKAKFHDTEYLMIIKMRFYINYHKNFVNISSFMHN